MRAKHEAYRDISGVIGPLYFEIFEDSPVKMYSFDTPACSFWQGVFNALLDNGMTEKHALEWLQSRSARHMLDERSERIEKLGYAIAKEATCPTKS